MSEEPRIIDGADRRRKRLLEMLVFIHNKNGATNNEINGFMLMRFGLKNKTSADYRQELHLARLITQIGVKWFTTENYKRFAKHLYS